MTENITVLNSNQKYFLIYSKIFNCVFFELLQECICISTFKVNFLLKVSLKRMGISLDSIVSKVKNKSINKYYTQFVLPEMKQELTVEIWSYKQKTTSTKTNYYLEMQIEWRGRNHVSLAINEEAALYILIIGLKIIF